ncbi:phage head closure protein [Candidatus Pantoea formicae]|uniref:phage head closure protein n=1 Tax=Candidatus Pantoea formicae TaxID=2608355 RepID=UPI003EDA4D70
MQAGRLRDRVTILNFITTRLPSGQQKESWQDGRTVWAEIKGISGREILTSGAEKSEATIRVWVRVAGDISSASRFRCESGAFKGEVIDVVSPPVPDTMNDRMEILCRLGVKT